MGGRFLRRTAGLFTLLLVGGCDLPQAHGDANAIIVGATPGVWAEIEERVEDRLEPVIQTIANERAFRVTWHDPDDRQVWGNLRRFRQVVVIGTEEDPWVADALAKRGRNGTVSPPELFEVEAVWSRTQRVYILVLPPGAGTEGLEDLIDDLQDRVERHFLRYATNRMFTSGRNAALADSLRQNVGFAITLPNVYRYSVQDSVFRFRNDNPTPSELIREVGVSWMTPLPESLPDPEALVAWRNDFAEDFYHDPQLVGEGPSAFREITQNGREGVEYRASWQSPPGAWPAGGPFITRVVACPEQDRLYHVDAWLYAPGQDKYEFMIQLETLLNSFECA